MGRVMKRRPVFPVTVKPFGLVISLWLKRGGHRFSAQACAAGAVAILSDTYEPSQSVMQLIHADVALAEAMLVDRFYDSPSAKLFTVGITGTNGRPPPPRSSNIY